MDILGQIGVGIFVAIAALNGAIVVRNLIKRDRHVSMIPVIGGLIGFLGFLAVPSLRYYAVAPLLLDLGTASFVVALPFLLREVWQTCSYNLLSEYVGCGDRKTVHLRLFRHGIFTLKQEFDRKPHELGIVGCSTIGEWFQASGELRLRINEGEAVFHIVDVEGQTTLRQVVGYDGYEESKDLALGEVKFQRKYAAPRTRSNEK